MNIYAGVCVQGTEIQFVEGGSEIKDMVYDLRRQQQISLSSAKISQDSLSRIMMNSIKKSSINQTKSIVFKLQVNFELI